MRKPIVDAVSRSAPRALSNPIIVDPSSVTSPKYSVLIGGQDLNHANLAQYVKSVMVAILAG